MGIKFTLKILIKKITLIILSLIGYAIFLPIWSIDRKNKLLILRYHSISDHRRHEVNVKTDAFKKQMGFLAKHYKLISLRQGVDFLRTKNYKFNRPIAVTFDDGYKDNYTNAYMILKQLHIPASIFLVAGYIGTNRILSHDMGDNPLHNFLLSWDEVRKMQQDGVEFGSHTLSHANLGKQDVDIQHEIVESKSLIEKELNNNVWAISYPFGLCRDFNQQAKRTVYQAGYTCGCSAKNGVNDSSTDIFELKRIGIEASDNMFTFRAKLNGALDLLVIKDKPILNKLLNRFNKLIGV